jgi:hypothetical protein
MQLVQCVSWRSHLYRTQERTNWTQIKRRNRSKKINVA